MENITPDYVDFEIGKLLKEKEFDVECKHYYEIALTSKKDAQDGYSGAFGWKKGECNFQNGYFINNWKNTDLSNKAWFLCAAPEISLVVKWLYLKHNIWIVVNINIQSSWYFELYNLKDKRNSQIDIKEFEEETYTTPEQAYLEAIKYTLTKLI